jgi:prepilin-type N-terminal cleavage/methylation domain-containing protein
VRRLRHRLNAEGGFTLVELIIALTITGIVASATASVLLTSLRAEGFARELRTSMDDGRVALDRIRRELRSARRVYTDSTARTLHVWIDRDQDNLQDTTEQVTFQVRDDPTGPRLVRFTAAAPTPVLVVRNIALADAFAYPTASTPTAATRVVTMTFTADVRTTGGPQPITVTDSVRLRNVA